MRFIAEEVREILALMGCRTVEELIGHTDRLEADKAVNHWKTRGLDFSHLFYQPKVEEGVGRFKQMEQDHGLDGALDNTTLLALCAPGPGSRGAGGGDAADPQCQPRRRHHRRQRK